MKLKHSAGLAAGIAATTALLVAAAAWANPQAHGVGAHLTAMRDAIMPMQKKLHVKASAEGFRTATHATHATH
jgi:hypothetical protein